MRDAAQVAPPRQDLGARHQEKRAQQATVRLATVPGHLDDQAPPVNKVLKWPRGIHLQLPAVQSPWLPTVDSHRQAAKDRAKAEVAFERQALRLSWRRHPLAREHGREVDARGDAGSLRTLVDHVKDLAAHGGAFDVHVRKEQVFSNAAALPRAPRAIVNPVRDAVRHHEAVGYPNRPHSLVWVFGFIWPAKHAWAVRHSGDYLVVAEVHQNDSACRVVGPFVVSVRAQQGEADAAGEAER
eukprot:scaffold35211_cov68-Phaeocystis_antarctica.AAC.5